MQLMLLSAITDREDIFINVEQIALFYKIDGGTEITFKDGTIIEVAESPHYIADKITERTKEII